MNEGVKTRYKQGTKAFLRMFTLAGVQGGSTGKDGIDYIDRGMLGGGFDRGKDS